jgi:hypothetical protein
MKRTLCFLALIGVTSVIGYSQETGSEYVSPSEAVPTAKAPKMQVLWLNPGETTSPNFSNKKIKRLSFRGITAMTSSS